MFSTCFETESSYLGRRLCIQLWYGTFHIHQYKCLAGIVWYVVPAKYEQSSS